MGHIVWHDEFHMFHEVLDRVFRLEAECGNKQIAVAVSWQGWPSTFNEGTILSGLAFSLAIGFVECERLIAILCCCTIVGQWSAQKSHNIQSQSVNASSSSVYHGSAPPPPPPPPPPLLLLDHPLVLVSFPASDSLVQPLPSSARRSFPPQSPPPPDQK